MWFTSVVAYRYAGSGGELDLCRVETRVRYVEEISISCCAEGHVVGFVSATRVNFHTNKDSATDSTLVPALQRLSTRSE